MKEEYELLKDKIEEAERKMFVSAGNDDVAVNLDLDLAAFSRVDTKNHPTVVKVFLCLCVFLFLQEKFTFSSG